MLSCFERKVILRFIMHGNKQKFTGLINLLAIFGIALGVMTLIIVMSVMNGYESQFIKRITGVNGNFTISNASHKIYNYNLAVKNLQRLECIEYVAPVFNGQAIVNYDDKSTGIIVKGVDSHLFFKKPIMQESYIDMPENAVKSLNDHQIYIGTALASTLGVSVGESIKLVLPTFSPILIGSVAKIKSFKIAGIFDLGWHEHNAGVIYINIKIAQEFFAADDYVSEIEIVNSSREKHQYNCLTSVRRALAPILQEELIVSDCLSNNKAFLDALKIEKNTMFFILSLIVIMACFNVLASLTMLVKDKLKSIAILRSLGASSGAIIKIFMSIGFLLGSSGALVGAFLGVVFVLHINNIQQFIETHTTAKLFDPIIYFLTYLPSEPKAKEIIYIVVATIMLSLLATIYPTYLAVKQQPDQALRHE
jgi:lipoprotein-releasing system permease protein